MTFAQRRRIHVEITCARYFDAIERGDLREQLRLEQHHQYDAEITAALLQVRLDTVAEIVEEWPTE